MFIPHTGDGVNRRRQTTSAAFSVLLKIHVFCRIYKIPPKFSPDFSLFRKLFLLCFVSA